MGRRNIWRPNGQESSQINDRHQTIHPRISENTKKDKHKNKNKTKPHAYTFHIQAAENKIQKYNPKDSQRKKITHYIQR